MARFAQAFVQSNILHMPSSAIFSWSSNGWYMFAARVSSLLERHMKVLIAEDDRALSLFLKKSLEMDGHQVICVADGLTAGQHIQEVEPDLLVLDLGLPHLDGVDVLRNANGSVPAMSVIVLTGRSDTAHKIECLNLGADDYLVKPFSLHELLARCRAVRRRRSHHVSGVLAHGDLRMNRIAREVSFHDRAIELTAKEFTLLEYLLLNRGRAVSRQELLREVWRMAPDAGTNVVDVYVNYLRRKLGPDQGAALVETLRGEGYAIGVKALVGKRPLSTVAASPIAQAGAA